MSQVAEFDSLLQLQTLAPYSRLPYEAVVDGSNIWVPAMHTEDMD